MNDEYRLEMTVTLSPIEPGYDEAIESQRITITGTATDLQLIVNNQGWKQAVCSAASRLLSEGVKVQREG